MGHESAVLEIRVLQSSKIEYLFTSNSRFQLMINNDRRPRPRRPLKAEK